MTVTSSPMMRSRYATEAMPASAVNVTTKIAMMYMPVVWLTEGKIRWRMSPPPLN